MVAPALTFNKERNPMKTEELHASMADRLFDRAENMLTFLVEDGFIELQDGKCTLTEKGREADDTMVLPYDDEEFDVAIDLLHFLVLEEEQGEQ
jgi:hypothetical protein